MRGARAAVVLACAITLLFAVPAQAAFNVTINNGVTTGGTWDDSGFIHSFNPTADNAAVNTLEIQQRLGVGDVVINTGPGGTQAGDITVTGGVTWTSVNTLTLFATRDTTVNAAVTANAGKLTITNSGGVGTATQTAPLTLGGGGILGSPTVNMTNAANEFGGFLQLQGGNVSVTDSVGLLELLNVDVTGALSATATGGGIQATDGVQADGPASFSAQMGALNFPNVGNDFGAAVSLQASDDATIADANSLTLGNTNVGGNFAAAAGAGGITGTGAITAGGFAGLSAPAGPITLMNSGNDFEGQVALEAADEVGIADANSLLLGNSTIAGGLTAQARDLILGDFESASAELVAGRDVIVLPDAVWDLSGDGVLVTDDATPAPGLGPGGVTIGAGAELTSTTGPFAIYSARRDQNEIDASALINGAAFTPGAEFVDTAREVWGTAFPAGTAASPFTIFYKQSAPPSPPPPDQTPAPETTITKKPRNTLKTKPGVMRKKVTYEFVSSIPASSFSCTLDGKTTPCASPFKKRVKKGKHTFSVAAVSPAGKADGSPAEDAFKVKRRPR